MNYADTGFLVSLYLQEVTSTAAIGIAAGLLQPIQISQVTRLEFENAMYRAVFQQRISSSEASVMLADFESDIVNGIYQETKVDADTLFIEASTLAARHTPLMGTRTLDLLHVAAAQMLGSQQFLSFDTRQRASAAALGMTLLPA